MEKKNKFKIVIPSYNNEKWVETNIASIINQTYTNYDVLYINDASSDSTPTIVQNIINEHQLTNWTLLNWTENKQRGFNVNPNESHIINFMDNDEDILMFVDGDDWLIDDNVLEKLNDFYNEHNPWMTYGGMYTYPTGKLASPQNTHYSNETHEKKLYRQDTWRASHLRSFKWFLYNKIKKEDLIWSKTGDYYYNAEDLAVSFFCMEMCPKEKIGVVDFPTYSYNEDPEIVSRGLQRQNKDINNPEGQEAEIRSKAPYDYLVTPTFNVFPTLAGGLGNMMFQLAAAKGIIKITNHKLVCDFNHVGTLHTHPSLYRNNIFKNIETSNDQLLNNYTNISIDDFRYNNISLPNTNTKLEGYFQSYKYFDHIQEEIIKMFSPDIKDIKYVQTKYNVGKGIVSLHVRRGNYTNLSDYHHNLNLNYYLNAIDYFENKSFLVCSDDIEWCREHFKGDRFQFIEEEQDYIDLYAMSLCEHHIIANSTFSWWAAYLNPNPNKIVIYPDKWFGIKNSHFKTIDLFPDEWVCLTDDLPNIEVNIIDEAFKHLENPSGKYSQVHRKIPKHIKYVRNKTTYDGITLVTDSMVNTDFAKSINSKHKIAWLLECREINPISYNTFKLWKDDYDFVLTHDSELLKQYPDNTKLYSFGGTWIKNNNYGMYNKSKVCSMIYSHKNITEGHKLRHKVANLIESGVDLFGNGTINPLIAKEEGLVDYQYSIIIENTRLENYFTEKLIDCLMVGTIPIYWGCPNISDYFDDSSILSFSNLDELQNILSSIGGNTYSKHFNSIQRNFEKAKKYCITEDLIYEDILCHLDNKWWGKTEDDIIGIPLSKIPPLWQSSPPPPIEQLSKPFENYTINEKLKKLIQNKRIAYVCPSPHLKGKKLGNVIDSYDLVVRVNQSYEIPESDWEDYGSRTDIVINCLNEYKRKAISDNVTFVNSLKHVIGAMVSIHETPIIEKLMNELTVDWHNISDEYIFKCFNEIGTTANTGLMGIIALLNYNIKELFITGMTFYNMNTFGEIYNDTYQDEAEKVGNFKSNIDKIPNFEDLRIDIHQQQPQIDYFKKIVDQYYGKTLTLDDYLMNKFVNRK